MRFDLEKFSLVWDIFLNQILLITGNIYLSSQNINIFLFRI